MSGNNFSWLWQALGAQQWRLVLAALLALAQCICAVSIVVLLCFQLDMSEGALITANLVPLIKYVVILLVARYSLLLVAALMSHKAAFELVASIKLQLCERLLLTPLDHLDRTSIAQQKQVIQQDTDRIEVFIAHHVTDLFSAIMLPVVVFTVLLYLLGWYALIALLPLSVAGISQWIMMQQHQQQVDDYFSSLKAMNASASELVTRLPLLRLFPNKKQQSGFAQSTQDYLARVVNWFEQSAWPYALFKSSLLLNLLFLSPLSLFLYHQQVVSLGEAVTIVLLGVAMLEPLLQLAGFSSLISQIMLGVDRIRELMGNKQLSYGELSARVGALSVNHLCYRYEQQAKEAVKNLNLNIKVSEKVAVVGPSGSGKSTLLHLLSGLLEPHQGEVAIGGASLQSFSYRARQQMISVVFQHNHFFAETLRSNLLMGGAASDKALADALSLSRAKGIVEALPFGLDTVINNQVYPLSGGEQQRLAIARSLLKPADVYLFDEATSFADASTEKQLMATLFEHLNDKTLIYVTHRISAARLADRIIVMDEGEVVASGSHARLIKSCNLYQRLCNLQSNSKKEAEVESTD